MPVSGTTDIDKATSSGQARINQIPADSKNGKKRLRKSAEQNGSARKSAGKKRRSKSKSAQPSEPQAVDLAKGSRGIDTLLRNAYRAQLDMLALAATKANIMISLNGILMSMLIISSTQLVSMNGHFILPIALFLITCAAATTFAVFAARPEISRNTYTYPDFASDDARLMVFEEFSDLSEAEYIDAMSDLLRNPARTYNSMLAHIHELGAMADRKYSHLYYSYTVFMTGTITTVLVVLTLFVLEWYGVLSAL